MRRVPGLVAVFALILLPAQAGGPDGVPAGRSRVPGGAEPNRREPIDSSSTNAARAGPPSAESKRTQDRTPSADPSSPAADASAAARTDSASPAALPAEVVALAYRTEIAPTGDAALDAALAAASQLRALQERAPTGSAGLLARAVADQARLGQALQSEGYWGGAVRVTLAGRAPDDPALAELLAAAPPPVVARIEAEPRERYRFGAIALLPADAAAAEAVRAVEARPFGLTPGEPARVAPVLAAEATLRDRLLEAGHPFASAAAPDVLVDHDRRTVDVTFRLVPGPRARFAAPAVDGTSRVDPDFLRRQAAPLEGQPYSPERLERARRELSALGAFDSVRARAGESLDAQGRLPVTFTVAERARRALGASAAYETNYGPSFRVYWEHRNLLGGAERLRLEVELARLGSNTATPESSGEPTIRAAATFRSPGFLRPDQVSVVSLALLRERLTAWDRDAVVAGATVERRLSDRWTVLGGPGFEGGRIGPPGGPLRDYSIAFVTAGARYDNTASPLDPRRGWRLAGTIAPSYSLEDGSPFAPLRATASTYLDLLGDGRGVLALRGVVGSLLGAERERVPESQRFYAGGGGSVRGYDYQSIGPRDARRRPLGGGSLVEASAEWRQRIWGDVGGVAFLDAGSVGRATTPGFDELRVGAGVGVRYFTAIGPIRADVAVPLVKQPGSSGYGLYVGIGQAF